MGQKKKPMGSVGMRLYIIHGWTYTLQNWQDIARLLKDAGIEPVLLKVPGLTAKSDKEWTVEDYIAWLDEQLAGEKHPIIVGHSNGGRIALAYSLVFPERFKKLILVDSAGVGHLEKKRRAKLKFLSSLARLGKVFGYIPLVRKIFYRLIGASDYYNAPPNMKRTMQNMLAYDAKIDLSKIKTPTTIIWGSEDKVTPLADGLTMKRLIVGSALHIVYGAKHAPMKTHPKEVTQHILQALEKK